MASKSLREISTRISSMSLRERVFIFVAAAVMSFALMQTLLIDTVQHRKQQAADRLKLAADALDQISKARQMLGSHPGLDPDQAMRQKLAAEQAHLADLNDQLAKLERTLIPPEHMNQVFKNIVRVQDGIRIVGFKTLSPQPVALPGAPEGAPAAYYRHGFEVTVRGHYAELVTYLERLEASPWRLNWVEATLDTTDRPILTLTLTVHTLSLEEAWLRV